MSSVCPPDYWVACTPCKRIRSNSGSSILRFFSWRWKKTEKKNQFVLDDQSGRCIELDGAICRDKDCSLLESFAAVFLRLTRPIGQIGKKLTR